MVDYSQQNSLIRPTRKVRNEQAAAFRWILHRLPMIFISLLLLIIFVVFFAHLGILWQLRTFAFQPKQLPYNSSQNSKSDSPLKYVITKPEQVPKKSISLLFDEQFGRIPNETKETDKKRIAIVTIVNRRADLVNYNIAMGTVDCYCQMKGYKYIVIEAEKSDLARLCKNNDFFFKRHCIARELLDTTDYEYYLFIDGDMGVVNPMHRIEEYIIPGKDIIFYERIWNFEFMAGSFLAKNTEFTKNFLFHWASYEKLNFAFTDNGAIQAVVLDYGLSGPTVCDEMHQKVIDAHQLFTAEACVRNLMMEYTNWQKHIGLIPKAKAWARDGWITYGRWSTEDFIHHGWSQKRLGESSIFDWRYPFKKYTFDATNCTEENFNNKWQYNMTMKRGNEDIQKALNFVIIDVQKQFQLALEECTDFAKYRKFGERKYRLLFDGLDSYPNFFQK